MSNVAGLIWGCSLLVTVCEVTSSILEDVELPRNVTNQGETLDGKACQIHKEEIPGYISRIARIQKHTGDDQARSCYYWGSFLITSHFLQVRQAGFL